MSDGDKSLPDHKNSRRRLMAMRALGMLIMLLMLWLVIDDGMSLEKFIFAVVVVFFAGQLEEIIFLLQPSVQAEGRRRYP